MNLTREKKLELAKILLKHHVGANEAEEIAVRYVEAGDVDLAHEAWNRYDVHAAKLEGILYSLELLGHEVRFGSSGVFIDDELIPVSENK